jgi:hypothetical protein
MRATTTPYFNSIGSRAARDDIIRRLSAVGCTEIAIEDDLDAHVVVVRFVREGRKRVLRGSAAGWAAAHLVNYPHVSRNKLSSAEYHERLLTQGHIAASGILRDLIRCQLAAVQTGILTFEEIWTGSGDGDG